ncbi:hypothetical protein BGW80DRAFT_1556575 [Lactifluus volemus]|nr:hypothetical protein BGW80DRAFT_1556575 [Lactifluus volemus]
MEVLPHAHEVEVITQEMKWKQRWQELRKWLSPPDPLINHYIACRSHHEGTRESPLEGKMCEAWKSTPSLLLVWIYGKRASFIPLKAAYFTASCLAAGLGKYITCQCSAIIQEITSLCDAGLASMGYVDFREEDKKSYRNLLLSLLLQLSAQSDICCDVLSRLHSAHPDDAATVCDDALTKCLKEMFSQFERPIYLFLDALDEVPHAYPYVSSPQEKILSLVKDLVGLRLPHLHVCVTGRPKGTRLYTLDLFASFQIGCNESGQNEDIVKYVKSVVYSDANMRRLLFQGSTHWQ